MMIVIMIDVTTPPITAPLLPPMTPSCHEVVLYVVIASVDVWFRSAIIMTTTSNNYISTTVMI